MSIRLAFGKAAFNRARMTRGIVLVGALVSALALIIGMSLGPVGAQEIDRGAGAAPGTQVLDNPGFERAGATAKEAFRWRRGNANDDQRVCNRTNRPGKPDVIVAHTGKCAFRFIGQAGRTTTLTQAIQPPVGNARDLFELIFSVKAFELTGGVTQARLLIEYHDGSNATLSETIPDGTYDYQSVAIQMPTARRVKSMRIQIRMEGGSGRFFVDTLRLRYYPDRPPSSPTISPSYTYTATPTETGTSGPSATPSSTHTHTATPTRRMTSGPSSTPSRTFTPTMSKTFTPTPSKTFTPTPTNTPTATHTNTPTATSTDTPTSFLPGDYCASFTATLWDDYYGQGSISTDAVHLALAADGLYSAQVDGLSVVWPDAIAGQTPRLTKIIIEQSGETLWSGDDAASPTNTATEGVFNSAALYRIVYANSTGPYLNLRLEFAGISVGLDTVMTPDDFLGTTVRMSHPSGEGDCTMPLTLITSPTGTPYQYPCPDQRVFFGYNSGNGEITYVLYGFAPNLQLIGFDARWPNGGGAYWLRRVYLRYWDNLDLMTRTIWESSGPNQDSSPNTDSALEGTWLGIGAPLLIDVASNMEIVLDFDGTLPSTIRDWQFDGTQFRFVCGS